jgi:hypothetical protein
MAKLQTKSKERVAEHGEVFTAEREVKAMCDLVGNMCDDYSKRLRLYNKPIQKVLLFTKEGKVATYNINLDFYDK